MWQAIQTQTAKSSNRTRPAKRATNLSLSADVLDAAKSLQINVSQICDNYLRGVVRDEQMRRWRADEQSDLLDGLDSRVVIPLRSLEHFAKVKLPTRLTPVLRVAGKDYLLETPKMGSVPKRLLQACVACLADEQDQITDAMNFLFQGY